MKPPRRVREEGWDGASSLSTVPDRLARSRTFTAAFLSRRVLEEPSSSHGGRHVYRVDKSGIWVIDAKNYEGKVQRIDKGGWFSTDERLYVGRRDCTKLVGGMAKQVEAVRAALRDAEAEEVEVKSALCFVDAEWSLFAKPFLFDGVWVGWAKALGEQLLADGPLSPEQRVTLGRKIARGLPAA